MSGIYEMGRNLNGKYLISVSKVIKFYNQFIIRDMLSKYLDLNILETLFIVL